MQEKLINFETAKLAKEKGFDLLVSSYYQEDKILVNEIEAAKINSRLYSRLPEFKLFHNANSNEIQSWYSAPTQSLLQKWLREVHNLEVCIKPIGNMSSKEKSYSSVIMSFSFGTLDTKTEFKGYENKRWSYEEALEVGLQEALKLI